MSIVTSSTDGSPIRETIKLIQQMMQTDKCLLMEVEDKIKYTNFMRETFPTFYDEYPLLFKKVIARGDLTMLEPMLKAIEDIYEGKRVDKEAANEIGEQLAEKYLYPTFGKPQPKDESNKS
jgi:hypothetical protein